MRVEDIVSSGLNQKYKIIIPQQDFSDEIQKKLQNFAIKAKLPGFRPGKVPLNVVQQQYGESAAYQATEDLINSSVQKIIADKKLKNLEKPKVENETAQPDQDLTFTVEFNLKPSFETKGFNDIDIEKITTDYPKDLVEKRLQEVADQHVNFIDAPTRKAQDGDQVAFQMTVLDEKERVLGKFNAMPFTVRLGKTAFPIEGVMDQLVGTKLKDKKSIQVSFPETYSDKNMAGKTFACDILVTAVREAKQYPVGEELAKSLGFETLEKLTEEIRKDIENHYSSLSRLHQKRHLLDKLEAKYNFELPSKMVDSEFQLIWNQLQNEIKSAKDENRPLDSDLDKPEKELKEEYQKIAERRVRLGLIISQVSEENNVQITQREAQAAIIREALKYPQDQQEKVVHFFRNNPNALDHIVAPILEDKVVDFILGQVKLKERNVSLAEFKKVLEPIIPLEVAFPDDEEKTSKKETKKADKAEKEPAPKKAAKAAKGS